nr:MAG TPA: hypothetical protein [Caudoviricetes sp.]
MRNMIVENIGEVFLGLRDANTYIQTMGIVRYKQ